jgi:hypothetical protein
MGVVSFTPRLLYPHGKAAGTHSKGDFLVPCRLYRTFSSYGIRCTGDFSRTVTVVQIFLYSNRRADFPRTVPVVHEIFLVRYRLNRRLSSYGTGYTGDFPRTVPAIQEFSSYGTCCTGDFPRTVPAIQEIFLVR